MTSVLGSVTSWLVGVREPSPERPSEEEARDLGHGDDDQTKLTGGKDGNGGSPGPVEQKENAGEEEVEKEKTFASGMEMDLQEVSGKAIHAAKEWGSYLFSVGKAATVQVAKTAKQLKETVEEKTILGDFSREQEKFVNVNREKKKLSEAAVAPWIGYNEEEAMKTQILALSKDRRNLLRNPPAGVQFYFDYETTFPIAMVMLDEDPQLKVLRFELVPKQIKEEMFWRNYFYRVSLIKQSTQLTSMTHPRGTSAPLASKASVGENGSLPSKTGGEEKETEELAVGSPPAEQEFVSDAFQSGDINDEDLKKEMHQLGVTGTKDIEGKTPTKDDIPEWERELQAELQEYEVVDEDENAIHDAELEREIMNQIEADSKKT